jgi:hypothetical protein
LAGVLLVCLIAVSIAMIARPAAAARDPNDVDGPLDLRSVTGAKDGVAAPLSVTIRTWEEWGRRLLDPDRRNRLVVMFDVDADGASDVTARVERSSGALVAIVEGASGSASTIAVDRPNRALVSFALPFGTEGNPLGDVGIAARTRSRSGAACHPACKDRSPDGGFLIVGAGPSPSDSPTPTASPSPPGGQYTCTEVVGFSQTAQWSLEVPDFQEAVGDGGWQVRWAPGGAIYYWADPGFSGWDGAADSACANGADAPDRIVLTITSQEYESDSSAFVPWIEGAIEAARSRYPLVAQVVLQPVVGGPGNGSCDQGGVQVRATHNHPLIDAAIAQVVGGAVVAGPSPEVRTCADYSDSVGHLVDGARGPIGLAIADGYV